MRQDVQVLFCFDTFENNHVHHFALHDMYCEKISTQQASRTAVRLNNLQEVDKVLNARIAIIIYSLTT